MPARHRATRAASDVFEKDVLFTWQGNTALTRPVVQREVLAVELKRIITGSAMGLVAVTVLVGCSQREGDPGVQRLASPEVKAQGEFGWLELPPECVVKRPVSDEAKSSPRVSALVRRLTNPSVETRKAAAASLGKAGPAAMAAIMPLYQSLHGQNVFEVVFDGSYPAVVVQALADIAREDAVPISYAFFLAAEGENADPADVVIWSNVLGRVGPPAVGCVCQMVENHRAAKIRSAYVRALGWMGSQGALKGKKARAEAALKKASGDPDPDVRAQAEQMLARLAEK